MTNLFLFIFSFMFLTNSHADSSLLGKMAKMTVNIQGLSKNNQVLIGNGAIESFELSTGLYYETKNKIVLLEIPKHCGSLAEVALSRDFKFTMSGDLKTFNDKFASYEVAFNEKHSIRCEVSRPSKG
jgi:hypothetical protein